MPTLGERTPVPDEDPEEDDSDALPPLEPVPEESAPAAGVSWAEDPVDGGFESLPHDFEAID